MNKNYNENYVREAAYYNWQNAGCPSGKDEYFWTMAVEQLSSKAPAAAARSTKKASTKTATASASKKKTAAKK